jgi:hypothetical protein
MVARTPGCSEPPVIRHVVCLTWVPDASETDIAAVGAALAELPGLIPEIRRYALGADLGLVDGNADFGIVADFDDRDAWRRYQRHPAHEAVLRDQIRPILAARAAVQLDLGP